MVVQMGIQVKSGHAGRGGDQIVSGGQCGSAAVRRIKELLREGLLRAQGLLAQLHPAGTGI